ncbi:hypothetical protein DET57_104152 [Klebsiella oxytoca]|uniref:Uncharacterized protein n=1 Tax=Klebsiella oxytoca TaxID=571 RepID=A0A318G5Z6_KLEOX|nr:hypothetical protein DET57_104152 [Klebsiella oxytoca]
MLLKYKYLFVLPLRSQESVKAVGKCWNSQLIGDKQSCGWVVGN